MFRIVLRRFCWFPFIFISVPFASLLFSFSSLSSPLHFPLFPLRFHLSLFVHLFAFISLHSPSLPFISLPSASHLPSCYFYALSINSVFLSFLCSCLSPLCFLLFASSFPVILTSTSDMQVESHWKVAVVAVAPH